MDAFNQQREKFWEKHRFTIVALIVAVSSGAIWYFVHDESVKRLAEAVMITCLLALTVDRSLKGKLAREVARDVAPFAFGYGMPNEFVDEILYARALTLVRRDVEVDFAFYRVADHPEVLQLETTLSYTLINYSDRDQPYKHLSEITIDRYAEIGQCQITKASAKGRELSKEYAYDGNVPIVRQKPSPAITFGMDLKVSPNTEAPRNRFWTTTLQVVDADDSDVIYFTTPVIGMTARILTKPDDLDVGFIFGHRRIEDVKLTQPNCWRLDAAWLHWGSLCIWWKKR